MRACVVHSQDVDSVDAVAELIAGAKVALGASLPRVAMLFAGIDHDFAIVLEQINAQWPGIALIGCTTDGEMSSHILFAEDSLALVLLSGDDFHAVSGVARSVSTDVAGSIRASANDAVQRLAGRGGGDREARCRAAPLHHHARRPDRERVRCPQCVAGGVGRCGPDLRRHRRRPVAIQGHQAVPRHGSAPGFRAVPPLRGGCGLFLWCGYRMAPIGREGRVTDVDGHVVRAIDGRPATEFYREFLGNADITHLTEYPLAVTADDGRGASSYYLRAPGRTDEAGGCIHFLGDVPDGARVHITTTNRDQILAATRSSFQHALDDFPKDSGGGGKPALALCISCAGRKQILGSRTQEEVRIVNELLGDVPAAGFYGYGEIARLAKDGISHYHNETFTTLLLGGRVGSA